MWEGNGQDDGSKSPSLSNLSLARVKERLAPVEDRRCEKDEDNVQAFVGDSSTSMSKELIGDLKKDDGRAIDLGEEGYG